MFSLVHVIHGAAMNIIKITSATCRPSDQVYYCSEIQNTDWSKVARKHPRSPEPGVPRSPRPDASPRGRQKDDETACALKSSFALRAYDMGVLNECRNRLASHVPGDHSVPAKAISAVEKVLVDFRIPSPDVEALLKAGAREAKSRAAVCSPALRPRLPENLAPGLEKDALIDYQKRPISLLHADFHETQLAKVILYFDNIIGQQVDALKLISRGIATYSMLISGNRKISHSIRNGDVPRDETATLYELGTDSFQKANFLNYFEKFRLALFAPVSPSDIWWDTKCLDPSSLPECTYFQCAILVGQLASGQTVEFSNELARILVTRVASSQRFMTTNPDEFPAKEVADFSISTMLMTVFDSDALVRLGESVRSGRPTIKAEPSTPAGYEQAMLSYFIARP